MAVNLLAMASQLIPAQAEVCLRGDGGTPVETENLQCLMSMEIHRFISTANLGEAVMLEPEIELTSTDNGMPLAVIKYRAEVNIESSPNLTSADINYLEGLEEFRERLLELTNHSACTNYDKFIAAGGHIDLMTEVQFRHFQQPHRSTTEKNMIISEFSLDCSED